jgi:hypothetical protein
MLGFLIGVRLVRVPIVVSQAIVGWQFAACDRPKEQLRAGGAHLRLGQFAIVNEAMSGGSNLVGRKGTVRILNRPKIRALNLADCRSPHSEGRRSRVLLVPVPARLFSDAIRSRPREGGLSLISVGRTECRRGGKSRNFIPLVLRDLAI